MGCGWGYGNYRNKNEREGPVIILIGYPLLIVVGLLDLSGGILGSDAVLTICIPDEMMMML